MSDHKFNATLKAAQGYDAPWLTIGADSPEELRANLAGFAGLDVNTDAAALVTAAASKLQSFWTAKDTLGAQVVAPPQSFTPQQAANVQQYQQSAAQPAPVGPATQYITGQPAAPVVPQQQAAQPPAPSCQHGQMTFRSGTKNGKDWSGYFCPTPRGTPGQCKPVFN
jgi:hypothetical protein